jgi:hypothetical protein
VVWVQGIRRGRLRGRKSLRGLFAWRRQLIDAAIVRAVKGKGALKASPHDTIGYVYI